MSVETQVRAALKRAAMPDWPRLMPEELAADYLGVGTTMLRDHGPKGKRWRGRVLYDRRDLDLFADALGGEPLDAHQVRAHSRTVEGDFFAERKRASSNG